MKYFCSLKGAGLNGTAYADAQVKFCKQIKACIFSDLGFLPVFFLNIEKNWFEMSSVFIP